MLWQQKFFDNRIFSGPSALGQAAGTCTLSPDGTTSCPTAGAAAPAAVASAAKPDESFPIVPVAIGGAALVGAILLLLK